MEELLKTLKMHDHIAIRLLEFPEIRYAGTFRGRIKDSDHCVYDKDGSAIWVTEDHGFEMFVELEDISSIVIG